MHRKSGKPRKGFTFHDPPPIPDGPGQSAASMKEGYQELHTVYNQRGTNIESSAASIYVPPSPVKPRPPTAAKRGRSPSPTLPSLRADTLQVESSVDPTYHGSNIVDGTAQSIWSKSQGLWDDHEDKEQDTEGEHAQKKRCRGPEKHPLNIFTEHIDPMVDELLRLDGPGMVSLSCFKCSQSGAEVFYRCRDCSTTLLWCSNCLLAAHTTAFLHRIEVWTGECFDRSSLKDLGLRIQLNHPPGRRCDHPRPAINDDFVVIDGDGIHHVALDYCGCHLTCAPAVQLLRLRLFPATTVDPRTAATFRVLETFQMLSFTAKTSAYEFLIAIQRRTDNTGSRAVPNRYHEFMRMVHEWRHLRLLKRMGRGHDPGGVKGTKEGECAVRCPACPQPGVNLPDGWDTSNGSWVHALFLAIDANFRLTRKTTSNESNDPGLNRGYAYLVEETQFKQYLADFGTLVPDDKSTCNNHDAIKSASIRGGKGLAASGLGIVQCSRHDMKRPTGCGDLQKGERYVNMDYFCLQTLMRGIPACLVISYDIACQWSINFVARCLKYPPNPIQSNPAMNIKYLVPKFHLPAHIEPCRVQYSFNLTQHVGRTDGEAPERGWSGSNDLAYSTREMGPGSRRDTLDDCFGDTNWEKATRMSDMLTARAVKAIAKRKEHVEAWVAFAATLPDRLVGKWTRRVQAWEADPTKPNPFENDSEVISETTVRHQLAKEDEASIKAGNWSMVHSVVTPSAFILQALGLEEAIRKHLIEVRDQGLHPTDLKNSELLEERNALRRRFRSWEKLQAVYMPTVTPHRQSLGEEAGAATDNVKDIRLFLPSEIVGRIPFSSRLANHEFQYRIAQAHTTLRSLKQEIVVRTHMINSKKKYSHGTSQMTRSNAKIQNANQVIRDLANKYRTLRLKLVALSDEVGDVSWKETLKELDDSDIRGLTSQEMAEGAGRSMQLGEGHKRLTWIWTVVPSAGQKDKGVAGGVRVTRRSGVSNVGIAEAGREEAGVESDSEFTDETDSDSEGEGDSVNVERKNRRFRQDDPALRIEFCRTRARAHRWQEECMLLAAEMRRVERFWEWDAGRWEERVLAYGAGGIQHVVPLEDRDYPELVERSKGAAELLWTGKRAYARRQADIRRRLASQAAKNHAAVFEQLTTMDYGNKVLEISEVVECG